MGRLSGKAESDIRFNEMRIIQIPVLLIYSVFLPVKV